MPPAHDPTDTPLPRDDGREPTGQHAVCLHPELINVVRQMERRRTPLTVAVIAALVTLVLAIAGVLYSQGQSAGATAVRVEAIEARMTEDRAAVDSLRERQRQDATDAAQRHTELVQALHALDSRLSRIEERLTPRR